MNSIHANAVGASNGVDRRRLLCFVFDSEQFRGKMYRRSLEKATEELFVKLFKSLAPGRAAGGKFELNSYILKGLCFKTDS